MDFLTHLMIGFLISSWFDGSSSNRYVVLGTLMAGLPDFDFLLYPLWKKVPITRHHGITHTIFFVTVASFVFFASFDMLTGISDTKLLVVMMLGGLSHIFCDFITNWGVPLFYPIRKACSKIDLDLAINPCTILLFFPGLIFLAATSQNYIPSFDLRGAEYVLGLIYIAYFVSRGGFKIYYTTKAENRGFAALPTIAPNRWKFAGRSETDEEIRIHLMSNPRTKDYTIPKDRLEDIAKCKELVHTYWLEQVQDYLKYFNYPYYETDCQDKRMKITWRSAEMGELLAVQVVYENSESNSWVEFKRGDRIIRKQL